ncbi:uncharacterized protein Triagg1_9156 [Trichoderma aggressivum f. europaeum]|uniref:Uncharacterized protein n=1 Tax=Trichoderma aggressivum f. europaeum TaxID=173218 RepID=A0AAE1IB03_9HYPO|nr:hypothetical protein Triagg1_9156 [Trichoderma aggressivum f. europaeum]
MSINNITSPQESLKNHNKPPMEDNNEDATISQFKRLLANDTKVKIAGIDCDGILRGKIMNKSKFLSSLKGGCGMSSAIFGWDMHDLLYSEESNLTSAKTGYADFNAVVDLESMRRLPFEDDIPFFLLRFFLAEQSVVADGRGLGMAGVELEFINFQTPSEDGYHAPHARQNLAAYLSSNTPQNLRPVTASNFGYSVSRPILAKGYFHDIFDQSLQESSLYLEKQAVSLDLATLLVSPTGQL